MHKRSFFQKTILGLVGFLTVLTVAFTPTQYANAQFVVSAPVLEGVTLEDNIWDRVWTNLQDFLLQAGTVGLVNLVQGFGQQLAAKSAEFIVTGDWGQQPLVFTQDWGAYLEDTASGALGEILMSFGEGINISAKGAMMTVAFGGQRPTEQQVKDSLKSINLDGVGVVADGTKQHKLYFQPFQADTPEVQQDVIVKLGKIPGAAPVKLVSIQSGQGAKGTFGLNLCSPNTPELLYAIPATLFGQLGGQEAGGDGSDGGPGGAGALEPRCDFKAVYNSWEQWAQEQGPTEFFGNFRAVFDINQNDLSIANAAFFEAGFGQIAAQRKAELERAASNTYRDLKSQIAGDVLTPKDNVEEAAELSGPKAQKDAQDATFNAFVASGESIVAAIAGTFLSTLSQKLMEKYFTSGAIPDAGVGETFAADSLYSVGSSRTSAFKAIYADVYTPKVREVNNYNILSEFQACPDRYPQQNNCVIDSDFANAVRQADSGDSITVREAIEKGLLHEDWYLLSSDDSRNSQKSCWSEAYCYSNIVKLRRARIIPIGWEIAAQESKGNPITLGEAVRKFDDCNYATDPNGVADSAHPLCHLVDPNWILKAPPMQCRAKVYSAVLQSSEAPLRQETCVDDPTCVATDENGKCLGAWGYCTREQNAWRFEGTRCEAQYDSCLTLRPREGGSVSYLTSTLNNNYCNDKNIGCRAYATTKDVNGNWNTATKQIYFNKDVGSCSQKAVGCTRLQNSNLSDVYLRVAPTGLTCTGNSATDPAACAQYAKSCRQDEVGCSLYAPTNGDPSVPAIAGAGNVCDKSCSGYAQYVQQPTQLEPAAIASLVSYFIPSTGQQCAASQAGCTGFTNLDGQASGGEGVSYFTSLRSCIKPNEAPNDTFFTWEGSDTTGYQVQSYQLKLENNSAYKIKNAESGALVPAYRGELAGTAYMDELLSKCTEALYKNRATDPTFDPNCREFLDAKGKRSYRLITEVVFASNDCATLRRNDVVSQAVCTSTGGAIVEGGACVYRALPKESGKCSAAAVGCRGYAGSTAGAGRIVFQDSFESTITSWKSADLSTESMAQDGRSLKINSNTVSPSFPTKAGKSYTISFWAKSTTPLTFSYSTDGGAQVKQFSGAENTDLATTQIPADAVWRPYTFGPIFVTEGSDTYSIIVQKAQSSGTTFIDNIYVKEADGVTYVIRGSWKTPQVCDANQTDALPGAALGCREYKDQSGALSYLTGFNKVCRVESVGCGAFINTFNSQSPSAQVFNTGIDKDGVSHPEDDVAVKADEIQYIVNNTQFACVAADVGCTEVGLPNKNGGVDTKYVKNNPDVYQSQMCKSIENRCDAYSSGSTTMYFKDPGSKTCTYQIGVLDESGSKVDGWFKTVSASGNPEPCDPTHMADGAYAIWKNGDAKYSGYAGVCPASANSCTAFVDHTDTSDRYPSGKPYYFLDNKGIDTTSCNGQVNLRDGCILFDKTSDPNKQWSSSLTLSATANKQGTSAVPVKQTAQLPEAITVVVDGKTVTCDATVLGNACKQVPDKQCLLDTINDSAYKDNNKSSFGQNKFGSAGLGNSSNGVPASCTPFKEDPNCGKERLYCIAKMREMQVSVTLSVPEGGWDGVSNKAHEATFGALCTNKLTADVDAFCEQQIGYYTGSTWIYDYLTPDFTRTQLLCGVYKSGNKAPELIQMLTTLQLKAQQACGLNDSNVVVRVNRDRVCGEWLACKTSFTIWNEQKGKWDDVCIDVGTCAQWKTSPDGKSAGECAKWVDTTDTTDKILDKTLYSSRDVTWKGRDYSGYSIYNQFQAADLKPIVNAGGDGGVKDIPLGYIHPTLSSGVCAGKAAGTSCSFALPMHTGTQQVQGVCLKNYGCVIGKSGGTVGSGDTAQPNMVARTCRAYPESDSPFPSSIVQRFTNSGDPSSKLANFQNANTCQRFDVNDGSPIVNADGEQIGTRNVSLNQCGGCSYQKAYYGQTAVRGQAKYYDLRAELPSGVCQGGFATDGESKDGKSCVRKVDCSDDRPNVQTTNTMDAEQTGKLDGLCLPLNKVQNVLGVEGYCLESDFSMAINGQQSQYACQTWHPATLMAGGTDIYNQYQEAGYVAPKNAGQLYCVQARGNAESKGAHTMFTNPTPANQTKIDTLSKDQNVLAEYRLPEHLSKLNSQGYQMSTYLRLGYIEHSIHGFINATETYKATQENEHVPGDYLPVVPKSGLSDIWNDKELFLQDIQRAEITILHTNESAWYIPQNRQALIKSIPIFTDGTLYYDAKSGVTYPYATGLVNDKNFANPKRLRLYWNNNNDVDWAGTIPMTGGTVDESVLREKLQNQVTNVSQITKSGPNWCPNGERLALLFDLVFDENGKFLGVRYSICDAHSGGVDLELIVTLHLREYCTVVERVVEDQQHKGWTDRLWANRKVAFTISPSSVGLSGSSPAYLADSPTAPFGSTEAITNPTATPLYVVASGASGLIGGSPAGGSPLSCGNGSKFDGWPWDAARSRCGVSVCVGGEAHGQYCNSQSDCSKSKTLTLVGGKQLVDKGVCVGTPRRPDDFIKGNLSAESVGNIQYSRAPKGAFDQPYPLLDGLFAKQYGQHEWIPTKSAYQLTAGDISDSSYAFVKNKKDASLRAPAVQAAICNQDGCSERPDGSIAVNNFRAGFVASASEATAVQVRFYTNVSPNQMPIKRVAVAWGSQWSGVPSVESFDGLYKNRRPVCDSKDFASSPEACSVGYYQFIHYYTFDSCVSDGGEVYTVNADGKTDLPTVTSGNSTLVFEPLKKGYRVGDRFCAFQPRVQIMDNWGWCNGSCEGEGKGCYEDGSKKCTNMPSDNDLRRATTPFNGYVIVREVK
ncbi:MAG: hypothetical protein AAB384_03260 [Patescibacteria group bacterium]